MTQQKKPLFSVQNLNEKEGALRVAGIINDIVMEAEARPESQYVKEGNGVVTSGGRLKGIGWLVSTVVHVEEASVSFSLQLPGGRYGYRTDILKHYVTEEIVREYALHARTRVALSNGLDHRDVELLDEKGPIDPEDYFRR